MNADVENTKLQLEKQILAAIAKEIRSQNMDADRAQHLSQKVLDGLHQSVSLADIHTALPGLVKDFSELGDVLNPMIEEYNQKVKSAIDSKVDELIKEGKVGRMHELVTSMHEGDDNGE